MLRDDTITTDDCGKIEFRRMILDEANRGHTNTNSYTNNLKTQEIHTGINSERKSSRLCQYEEK